jgi:hypothetical protein
MFGESSVDLLRSLSSKNTMNKASKLLKLSLIKRPFRKHRFYHSRLEYLLKGVIF